MITLRKASLPMVAALWIAILSSAVVAVYARHESRQLFSQLQKLESERDVLNIDWGRLQLEQSTWATHARIESIAHGDLGMQVPDPDQLLVVKP